MRALIFEFADGFTERALKFAHLCRNQLGKAKQDRRGNPAARQVFDDFFHVG